MEQQIYIHTQVKCSKKKPPGWCHPWAAAMVTCQSPRTARWASHAARLLSCCHLPDHSRGRGLLHHFLCEQKALCGLSSADGLRGLQQTARTARSGLWTKRPVCLNKSCKVWTCPWLKSECQTFSEKCLYCKFRMQIISVCKTACHLLIKWVIDSGHLDLNHIKTHHI